MKVQVVYTVNGTTCTDTFDAPRITATVLPEGHGAAKVEVYDAANSVIKWKLHAHCETIEKGD